MEYIRTIGTMAGNATGRYNISPEKAYLIIAIAVVAIIIGLILMKRPE